MKEALQPVQESTAPGGSELPILDSETADFTIALAGNPNVGKSTVFNLLTGLRQHTGNWPGKTVLRAEGLFTTERHTYRVVDLPGTYSLLAHSADEEVARDFLLFGNPDVTVVVLDATTLERNLNLLLQILEITPRVVVAVNLMDEAERKGIRVDTARLAELLGVPVVPMAARRRQGLKELLQAVEAVATGTLRPEPRPLITLSPRLAGALERVQRLLEEAVPGVRQSRWVALRLLDRDESILQALREGRLVGAATAGAPPGAPAPVDQAKLENLLQETEQLRYRLGPEFQDLLVESIYRSASAIAAATVNRLPRSGRDWDRRLDAILTSRIWGFPIMVGLLLLVFWLTISGSNVPSSLLSQLLVTDLYGILKQGASHLPLPGWLEGMLIDGMYLATAWVVSVMLPPMAIFFPLFSLLEDFGYLPRVAFNLDRLFRRVGAHGKQALTMVMGFGCNAAGVISTRIIESPRERLIAIITNNFSLCNGRWPTQILLASIFIGALAPAHVAGVVATLAVVGVALLGVLLSLIVSWLLSRTVLRGEPSHFSLELPPFRPPNLWQTLYTSFIDRTLKVLWRAVVFAAPCGVVIWLVAHVEIAGRPLAQILIGWLDPLGFAVGLNGIILLAYIIAIPANEIVIPTILMLTVLLTGLDSPAGRGVLFEVESAAELQRIFQAGGWTLLTAVNLMLFSLVHNPCSTTIFTIYKETGSKRWTALAALLPVGLGFLLTFLVATAWRAWGS
ncbi:MAG: hypothetical protein Kow00109_27690 [Acidobacteriota bacterium]